LIHAPHLKISSVPDFAARQAMIFLAGSKELESSLEVEAKPQKGPRVFVAAT